MIPGRVDFYVLNRADEDSRLGFACVVAAKAWQEGLRVYLQVDSARETDALDELLWSYQAASFVPHARLGDTRAESSPVLIGDQPAPPRWREALVSLTAAMPEGAERCNRVADLVGSGDAARQAGRERFKAWRALGVQPNSHEIKL